MAAKRIGILTGGGDVPGLNAVIKTVVYRASEIGAEVVGIRRGWEGLTHVDLDDLASRSRYILPLSRINTRTIDVYNRYVGSPMDPKYTDQDVNDIIAAVRKVYPVVMKS